MQNCTIVTTQSVYIYRYASEKIEKLRNEGKLKKRSWFNKWSALTLLELHGFLAIVFNMGIIKLPELEDYWKTSWVAEIPFFSRVMPRDHFELIFWMLHISHPMSTGTVKTIDKVWLFRDNQVSEVHFLTRAGSRRNNVEVSWVFCGETAYAQEAHQVGHQVF